MSALEIVVLAAYFTVLCVLALVGAHRFFLLFLYWSHRDRAPRPRGEFEVLPTVTVQLPLYNEATVVERLLEAVARLDYPRDLLEIQVLDDSVDETTDLARARCEELRRRGLRVDFHHRSDRAGFKAGALAAGLPRARGEYLAILDADFVPAPDLLRRTMHHFTDPQVGMVQVRWDHLNRRRNLLTRLQSVFLDGHFVIEHTARNRSGRCFNFNGTAGVWRRAAIEEAGGWQDDTLTEDLDLSYRAQVCGWRFVYLLDVTAAAELPADMNSFKAQQYRWAKGAIQTSRKLLPRIWSSDLPLAARLEATFHLTANGAYPLLLLLCVLVGPALVLRRSLATGPLTLALDLSLVWLATGSLLVFYTASQCFLGRSWRSSLLVLPGLMSLGVGLAVNNSRAVLAALLDQRTPFERTAKDGGAVRPGRGHRYRGPLHWASALEFMLGAYLMVVVAGTLQDQQWGASLLLAVFAAGFLYVGVGSVVSRWSRRRIG